jgi:hypothetical protein
MISGAARIRIKTVELAGFQPRRISRVRGARQSKKMMRGIQGADGLQTRDHFVEAERMLSANLKVAETFGGRQGALSNCVY